MNNIDPHTLLLLILSIYSIAITIFYVALKISRRRKDNNRFEKDTKEEIPVKSSRIIDANLRLTLAELESKIQGLNSELTERDNENRQLKARIKELEKELEENIKTNNNSEEQVEDRSQSKLTKMIVRKYYAGPYNNDANSFYSVNDVPTEKSLFILSVNSKKDLEANVEIYPDAIDKILGCKDLLDGVCDYSGIGNVLIMEKKGKAILKDNEWRIDKKMVIKFVEK